MNIPLLPKENEEVKADLLVPPSAGSAPAGGISQGKGNFMSKFKRAFLKK